MIDAVIQNSALLLIGIVGIWMAVKWMSGK
jgi:hypothetical protein